MTAPGGGLEWLALARGTVDRVAERRRDDAWLAAAWSDSRTRVLEVRDGRAPVTYEPQPALAFVPPARAPDGDRYLLGVDETEIAYFAVSPPSAAAEAGERGGGQDAERGAGGGDGDAGRGTGDAAEWAGLRRVGALLSDRDSGLLTHAVALHNWHSTHRHCPRCGAGTELAAAGHLRVCPVDGSEHFPRVDPAVIMLLYDSDDRVLLARGPSWPPGRKSVLAGFVEPGESLEQAVAREVREEVGLAVEDLRYLGSQPWPLPQSLMIGFFAHAPDGRRLRPDPEEIVDAAWYSRAELAAAYESGRLLTPGPLSIAAQLLTRWYGGPLVRD